MLLTEKKIIKRSKVGSQLYKALDNYSFRAKNLKNAVNYLIKQCSRIGYKLKCGELIYSWEKSLIFKVNCGIKEYNDTKGHNLKYIDNNNNFIADPYFLSFYLKNNNDYKALYATNAQIIIQNVCKDWKSYFEGMKEYNKNPSKFTGKPKTPGYLDSKKGRFWFTFTNQNIKTDEEILLLPKSLNFDLFKIKTNKGEIKQVRIKTKKNKIIVNIIYEKEDIIPLKIDNNRYMSIDLGVNNLTTVVSNIEMEPFIINGRPLKAINQYYNKKKAYLQNQLMICNNKYNSNAINALTFKRNNKIEDYLHKTSKLIIEKALKYNICKIIIGNNKEWKQESNLGKINNQNFVSIPFYKLIQMITYKAKQVGIEVLVVEEKYTSGTSYIDNEIPTKDKYNKNRRIKRGLFISNNKIKINADVNGAYQIMKKANINLTYKGYIETVEKINIAYPQKTISK